MDNTQTYIYVVRAKPPLDNGSVIEKYFALDEVGIERIVERYVTNRWGKTVTHGISVDMKNMEAHARIIHHVEYEEMYHFLITKVFDALSPELAKGYKR